MYRITCDGVSIYNPGEFLYKKYDIISADVTQELNTAGSLKLVIPPTNWSYEKICNLTSIFEVYDNDQLMFKGRAISQNEDFIKRKTVVCEGEYAYFNDSVYTNRITGVQMTVDFINSVVNNHNSQVDADKQFKVGNIDNVAVETSSFAFKQTMEIFKSDIVNKIGGYFKVRYVGNSRYLDYTVSPGIQISSNSIKFGVNLLDINKYIDATELYTVIIPYGDDDSNKNPVTIESVNGGKNYLENSVAVAQFGRIFRTVKFDGYTDPTALKTVAAEFVNKSISEAMTLDLTAVDFHSTNFDIDAYTVGNSYKVVSTPHNVDDYFLCSKKTTKLLSPARNSVSLGYTRKSLTDYI